MPYPVDMTLMQQAAGEIMQHNDFTSFSKRNTQVKTFLCDIYISEWVQEADCLIYKVKANRFLRGMVKGLVGTMLLMGKKKINFDEFKVIIESKDCSKADFSVPSDGLFLHEVAFS